MRLSMGVFFGTLIAVSFCTGFIIAGCHVSAQRPVDAQVQFAYDNQPQTHVQVKPVWIGKSCGIVYTYEDRNDKVPNCIKDVLSTLYQDQAAVAKIFSLVSGHDGSTTNVWIFYPSR